MTEERKRIYTEGEIMLAIRTAPDKDVPDGFAERVMAGLEPRRPSPWRRLRLWLVRPRVMTFRPLTVIPAVTLAVALLALAVIKTDTPGEDPGVRLATVRFVLRDADMHARQVAVIGSFNNWRAERSVMWYNRKEGAWVLEAKLPPGDHEYLFLVNGRELVPDPGAPMTRDDGFGNKNSIMFVNGDNEQAL
ncbi:MAG: glycoside hydrolase family 13 [Desulfovibrionaceae bacterium]|nr:glycoside hydrolase family 13 [Desulfovibrionaceae bacterium]